MPRATTHPAKVFPRTKSQGALTDRQRAMAVLHYQPYDRLPIVHFGFWSELLQEWAQQGHITEEEAHGWGDGNPVDAAITERLGFDTNWYSCCHTHTSLEPAFTPRTIRKLPDGSRHIRNNEGVVVLQAPGANSIPAEISHSLTDRASWKRQYRKRLMWSKERVTHSHVRIGDKMVRWDAGGLDFLKKGKRDYPYGLYCGSLYGTFRNIVGMEGACYMLADDEPLLDEILGVFGDLCFKNVKFALEAGAKFDFGHFWEDICFKNGPLVTPAVFAAKVGPHYKRITDLLRQFGIDIVSLDCDGMIDALIPIWLENGVNTMFPIEVGTWNASIAPWRQQYGQQIRGVGGTNKVVFAQDHAAVDAEVKRLKELVKLGGFIPCPDHRLPPDSKWELVQYYCLKMREA